MGWGAPLVEGFVRQSQKQGGAESQALSKTPPSSSRSADPASPQPPAHLALPWVPWQTVSLITYCPLPTTLPLPAAAVDPQASVQHFLGAASWRTSW